MKSGIDQAAVDPDVRPQDDLFAHVNGRWLATTQIPEDRAATAPSTCCARAPRSTCAPSSRRSPPAPRRRARSRPRSATCTRASWTRTRSRRSGVGPIADDLARVAAVADAGDVVAADGAFGRAGVLGLVIPFVNTDDRDPGRYVVYLEQAGLGLPDESYYREDAHADNRTAYVAHVGRMLALAGWPDPRGCRRPGHGPGDPAGRRALGQGDQPRPGEDLHPRRPRRPGRAGPGHRLGRATSRASAPARRPSTAVVVRQPDHVRSMAAAARGGAGRGVARLARLARRARAGALPVGRRRRGELRLLRPHPVRGARRCGSAGSAGSAWSRRRSARRSASCTSSGTSRRTPRSGWSSSSATSSRPSGAACPRCRGWAPTTRARGAGQARPVHPQDRLPGRAGATTPRSRSVADDLLGNVRRAVAFEVDRQLAKLGGPVDRDEWFMTPQTVNAYYNPRHERDRLPGGHPAAAVLRPRRRRRRQLRRHRRGHRARDRPRLRRPGLAVTTATGTLRDWWTDEDRAAFESPRRRAHRPVRRARAARRRPATRSTARSPSARTSATSAASPSRYSAYRIALGDEPAAEHRRATPATQRFFLGWAQVWRGLSRARPRRSGCSPSTRTARWTCAPTPPATSPSSTRRSGCGEGDGMWLAPEHRVRIF